MIIFLTFFSFKAIIEYLNFQVLGNYTEKQKINEMQLKCTQLLNLTSTLHYKN